MVSPVPPQGHRRFVQAIIKGCVDVGGAGGGSGEVSVDNIEGATKIGFDILTAVDAVALKTLLDLA